MERDRPQITNEELILFLQKQPKNVKIFCSVSLLSLDEPEETQEFIDWENRRACVAVEVSSDGITLGYI